jgi:hypothetical protein
MSAEQFVLLSARIHAAGWTLLVRNLRLVSAILAMSSEMVRAKACASNPVANTRIASGPIAVAATMGTA